jgi:hypothetical protein
MTIQNTNNIIIRHAVHDDIDSIMLFINKEWKDQHILSRDKSFFLYEHGNENKNKINFIIAVNEENNILGIIGFIICSPGEISDVCTVIWKVVNNSGQPALGIKLLQFISKDEQVRYILSPGINKLTIPIYNFLGMFTGELEHYYMLNPTKEIFEIAQISNRSFKKKQRLDFLEFSIKLIGNETEIRKFPFNKFKDQVPYKNESYFLKRYCRHPVYNYMIHGVYLNEVIVAIIVIRKQHLDKSSVLRLVDYYGDEKYLAFTELYFQSLLIEQESEFIDFYCYGFKNDFLIKGGFKKVSDLDGDIIPNYFSPFVKENIKIRFFSNTKDNSTIRLCKGDGDQDRPN